MSAVAPCSTGMTRERKSLTQWRWVQMRLSHLMVLLETANNSLVDNVLMVSMLESADRNVATVDMEPALVCLDTRSQRVSAQSAGEAGAEGPQAPKLLLSRLNTFARAPSWSKLTTHKVHDEAVREAQVVATSSPSARLLPINAFRRASTFITGFTMSTSRLKTSDEAEKDDTQRMSEWQAARKGSLSDAPPPSLRPFKPEGSACSTLILDEEKRKKVKDFFCLLDNLWKSVSMGATTVPVQ